MPPPEKAAKKAAKKAAAKHAGPKHHESKDLLRVYEHLGRIEILQKMSGQNDSQVSTLATLAQKELKAGHAKDAADLVRAAEHLSFASLGTAGTNSSEVAALLKEAIQHEFEHLTEKAEEHWEHEDESDRHHEVTALYQSTRDAAQEAYKQGSYRRALELARGAEALAHVKKHGLEELAAGKGPLKLPTS